MLEKSNIIYRNDEILINEVDGETVMMSIENGTYYGMNPTGNFVWNILNQERSIEEIVNKIIETFSLTEDQCNSDVLPFIQSMIDEKIILVKG